MRKQQAKAKPMRKQRQKRPAVARRKSRTAPIAQSSPITFTVYGPFATPITRVGKGAITFPSENPATIFDQSGAREYANKRGCYVMAIQRPKTIMPVYVGQTTRSSFGLEVFAPHKQNKYRDAALDFPRGPMVLFLLIPQAEGQPNLPQAIRGLEKELVAKASSVNPLLQNIKLVPRQTFCLAGVDNARPGQPRIDVQNFKKMMGYKTKVATVRKR